MARLVAGAIPVKLFALACAVSVSACAPLEPVQPWQKGILAGREMTFDSDALDSKFVEHTYVSKEATSKGAGVGAGGCGCN